MAVWTKRALLVAALLGIVLLLRTVPDPVVPQAHAQAPYCGNQDRCGSSSSQPAACLGDRPDQCSSTGSTGSGSSTSGSTCLGDRPNQCTNPSGTGGGGTPCFPDRPGQCSSPGASADPNDGTQGAGGIFGGEGPDTAVSLDSAGVYTTVKYDSVALVNTAGSGQPDAAAASAGAAQGQDAQSGGGQQAVASNSSAAGQDVALTVWIDLVPGVSVSNPEASLGTIATEGNRVVWRGFHLVGGQQASVNLNLASNGVTRAIQRVTVETVDTAQGEQRVAVLTPSRLGAARALAGTPRLPNTGMGGVPQSGSLVSRWLAATNLAVLLLLAVGFWSWPRLRRTRR